MSVTRYRPQMSRAFSLPLDDPRAFVRHLLPWFGLSLIGVALKVLVPQLASMALILNALAFGGFCFVWQRHLGGVESGPFPKAVLDWLRLLAWAFAYQILVNFEALPAPFIGLWLGDGAANADMLTLVGLQFFQLLIGGMFLVLPQIALYQVKNPGPSLQEMVLAGGLAVGLGYVLVGLPFVIATMMWNNIGLDAQTALHIVVLDNVVRLVISFWGMAVMAGYFTFVWMTLRETAPSVLANAMLRKQAAAEEEESPKPKGPNLKKPRKQT